MSTITLPCPECGADREFEQPRCADGHPTDCPDWACLQCGLAVFWAAAPAALHDDAAPPPLDHPSWRTSPAPLRRSA